MLGVFKGAPAPSGSGRQVSRRPAGQIEGDHTLCLCQGGEPLRAPLASVVGGLEADFVAGECHGSVAVELRVL
jgi:hypothetical protein